MIKLAKTIELFLNKVIGFTKIVSIVFDTLNFAKERFAELAKEPSTEKESEKK